MAISWNEANAAHLLRRAGFGAPRAEVAKALKLGQVATVDRLLAFRPTETHYKGKGDWYAAAVWWIDRMLSGKAPLQEKLALFWHGHFATAASKVEDSVLLSRQNRLFRLHAKGSFRQLVQDVSRDAAMLYWLDNVYNYKDHPNENYARELMELFTLGITDLDGNPNYTETDVREAARAFTGWFVSDRSFYFEESEHDFGEKTFRGRTGDFDGGDIVDQLVVDRKCAEYISKKLWEFFAYRNPERQIVSDLADVYLANDTNLEPVLRAIFLHDSFYGPRSRTEYVSSPVAFAVGVLRTLGTKVRRPEALPYYLRGMGQELYNPPNVAGWPGHLAWLNSVTRLNRMDYSWNVLAQRGRGDLQFKTDPVKLLDGLPKATGSKYPAADVIVTRVLDTFGIAASDDARDALVTYLTTEGDPENPGNDRPVEIDFRDREFVDIKLRGLVGTVLTLPEAYLA